MNRFRAQRCRRIARLFARARVDFFPVIAPVAAATAVDARDEAGRRSTDLRRSCVVDQRGGGGGGWSSAGEYSAPEWREISDIVLGGG